MPGWLQPAIQNVTWGSKRGRRICSYISHTYIDRGLIASMAMWSYNIHGRLYQRHLVPRVRPWDQQGLGVTMVASMHVTWHVGHVGPKRHKWIHTKWTFNKIHRSRDSIAKLFELAARQSIYFLSIYLCICFPITFACLSICPFTCLPVCLYSQRGHDGWPAKNAELLKCVDRLPEGFDIVICGFWGFWWCQCNWASPCWKLAVSGRLIEWQFWRRCLERRGSRDSGGTRDGNCGGFIHEGNNGSN